MADNNGLYIKQMQLGQMDNFVYILVDTASNAAVVIDPAWDVGEILSQLEAHDAELQAIWLTHGHHDHTEGVAELVAATGVPVYVAEIMPDEWRPEAAELIEISDGDTLQVGALEFRVIATPGHSPDGVCFVHRNHLIAGDTLFINGCGRCDLPTSDVDAMYDSLHNKLMQLPDNTIVYPGHDYGPMGTDTMAQQKQTNPYLNVESKHQFLQRRMG